ncbi:restriction endonuclease subunit S [Candidatus Agathobaculum pullicola]|uniref:restriction endonuclease subunit S n=1 Tax=Candidatus Agathobaculum pullicola TaxID=2838426 RepID=UPI003F8F521C
MTQKRVPLGNFVAEYSVRNNSNEDIPVYSVTNSQGFCREYFGKEVASKDKTTYKIVPYGYFAYNPSRINVGSVDWQRCEAQVIVSPLYNVFSVSDELDRQFLYYFLKSSIGRQMIRAKAAGSVRDNLKLDMLKEMTIPDSSLDDQRHCVATLDNLQYLIELRKKQLNELDNLVKARFVEMFGDPEFNTFGWDTEELGTLCDVGSSKRIYQNEQSQEGIPFWRISDLISKMDTGVADSGLFIPEERYVELKNAGLVPTTGDILVTSRGTLGRCYIIKDEDKFYFQDGMISWLSSYVDGITPLYLQYLFTMPGFRKQIDGMQAGSTVAYLSIAMLKKLRVMVPPIKTQNCFALFVEQLDKSKVVVQKALDEAQTLFDSLMQQYFG